VPRIDLPKGNEMDNIKLMKIQPEMGKAMATLANAIYRESSLDLTVREAVRMRMAQINACSLCENTRFRSAKAQGISEDFYGDVENWRQADRFDERTKLALHYSEAFSDDHLSLDQEFFDTLSQHFTPVEIYELTVTIAGLLANGRTLQVLQIDQP